MRQDECILQQCTKSLEKYGFTLEKLENGRYDIVDHDYHNGKACCVPYSYPDYGKQDLTVGDITTHTLSIVQNMQELMVKQKSNRVK
ncbi:MAG TPA: hypothetical protein VEP90_28355 [Methylomirabilota bacterium]|nr:hypothetical protein [Methylomirabilota bacterium]